MTHALAIRFLTSLADLLDNERATSPETLSLCLSQDFALKFASAAEHAAQWLATLPEVVEEGES